MLNGTRIQGIDEREKKRKASMGNKYALGKHWKLTEETKQKMRLAWVVRRHKLAM